MPIAARPALPLISPARAREKAAGDGRELTFHEPPLCASTPMTVSHLASARGRSSRVITGAPGSERGLPSVTYVWVTGPGRELDAFIPRPQASDTAAVNVILDGHLWEALELLTICFDGDENRGLERGKGETPTNGTNPGTKARSSKKSRGNALTGFLMKSSEIKQAQLAVITPAGLEGGQGEPHRLGKGSTESRRAQELPGPPWCTRAFWSVHHT